MAKILIFIGAHLCTAPRPQKEAETLAAAGHDVTVCGVWFDPELVQRDQALMGQVSYQFHPLIDFRPAQGSRVSRWLVRLQARVARELFQRYRQFSPALLGYGAKAMVRYAQHQQADLNIFHSEAGLWAGATLLKQGYPVGIDFEDWFSQDLLPSACQSRPVDKIAQLEGILMQQCTYKLTTAQGMASAMAAAYQASLPEVIYNTFPRQEGVASALQAPSTALKLHWFSHTIGPGRGLETLFAALPHIETPIEIHLRGNYPASSQAWMEPLIPEIWRSQLFIHPLVSNQELPHRIAEHDVGLALETPFCQSRNYTVTNKLFQYLLSGLATIATETAGQQEILSQIPAAGCLIPCDDAIALAQAINHYGQHREVLAQAKQAAYRAGQDHYCYEVQSQRLLALCESAISQSTPDLNDQRHPGSRWAT